MTRSAEWPTGYGPSCRHVRTPTARRSCQDLKERILSVVSATMPRMPSTTRRGESRVWVPAGDGYELSLDGAELSCRDDQGGACAPIPRRVLESRAYPA